MRLITLSSPRLRGGAREPCGTCLFTRESFLSGIHEIFKLVLPPPPRKSGRRRKGLSKSSSRSRKKERKKKLESEMRIGKERGGGLVLNSLQTLSLVGCSTATHANANSFSALFPSLLRDLDTVASHPRF